MRENFACARDLLVPHTKHVTPEPQQQQQKGACAASIEASLSSFMLKEKSLVTIVVPIEAIKVARARVKFSDQACTHGTEA